MLKYKLILLLYLSCSFIYNQTWKPFHIDDLKNHSNVLVNYSQIDNIAIDRIDDNIFREELTHDVIGYLPYWEYSEYPELRYDLLTHINYFSAELNPYGDIVNNHNWNNLYFITYAHERNVTVSLCATLFGQTELQTLLSDSLNRANAINNLLELVVNKNADGIDIDFELLPSNQRENLVLFMDELSEAFHAELENPIITMATPAIDWSNAWDYDALAQIVDGLFIMGYNYFYSGSSSAGPVSPLGGYFYDIDYTLQDYILKTNGQLDKLILGLPYYGYDWPVENMSIHSQATGNAEAVFYAEAKDISTTNETFYDLDTHSPWIPYEIWSNYNNASNYQQCWYEDSLSISSKYEYAKNQNIKGVGIWALGYDNEHEEMWGSIQDSFLDYTLGDINSDGILNVIDIVLIVNNILNNEPYNMLSDLNSDNMVNIQDIILLVNIILEIQ